MQADGVYSIEQTYCDGSTPEVLTAAKCTVPIDVLRGSVFLHPWGSSIYARVSAYNLYGYSEASSSGNGAVILTYPDKPVNLQEVVAARSATTITVLWEEGATNGGDTVDGYRLWFDQAADDFVILQPALSVLTFMAEDLTNGETYKFKVQSFNSYGYSEFSDEVAILCATAPDQPAVPSTSVFENTVVVQWDAPADNGTPILGYHLYLKKQDGTYAEELTDCDGSSSQIVADTSCTVPLSTLTAEPFLLVQGAQVNVVVSAYNAYGESALSEVGGGALI